MSSTDGSVKRLLIIEANYLNACTLAEYLIKKEYMVLISDTTHNRFEAFRNCKPHVTIVGQCLDSQCQGEIVQSIKNIEIGENLISYNILIVQPKKNVELPKLLKMGVNGIIHHQDGMDALHKCLENHFLRKNYWSPTILGTLDKALALHTLTRCELNVINFIQVGYSNYKISNLLHISENTVKNHRKNIKRKLGVNGGKNSLIEFIKIIRISGLDKLGEIT